MKSQELTLDSISWRGAVIQVLKNWWVVVCLTLAVFLGATGLGMLTYQPAYTASATLVIRVMGSDAYSSLAQATQMTTVYSEVFQSSALRNMIAESIGEQVEGTISCTQISETNLLTLSTTSPTPRQAYLFISSALANYEEVAGYVFTDAVLEIVQEPSVPESPSNVAFLIDHRLELTLLAAVGSVALILLIYLLRNTVKVSSKAEDLLDGKVLGTVPYERKQSPSVRRMGKKREVPALVLTSSLVSMKFSEANRRAATRLEAHLREKQFQVMLITSVEENEGKSTVAANLAIALAEHGKRVLLVDGDFRKPAQWRIFDESPKRRASFSDVLMGKLSWEQAAAYNERGRFWELFQFQALGNPTNLINSEGVGHLLQQLRQKMDYIIIDCSPVAAAADAEIWMHHADTVTLVVREDCADVRVINDTVDVIWKSAGDFSGFVLNAFQDESLQTDRGGRYGNY
ncbi:MAG TPA: polysaccharide biosynthesis tyrosine autokinase [Candidatus Onthomonas avicola]|nr:polysaccharide biosynthesis tyrosine autokinase [Candidatus Onthomonas avicola]